MSDPVQLRSRASKTIIELIAHRQWSKVVDTIEAGYPIHVCAPDGRSLFELFIASAAPDVDPLNQAWHQEVMRSFLLHGLTASPDIRDGHTPLSLVVHSLRWDLANLLASHGHPLQAEGLPSLWPCALDGYLKGRSRATADYPGDLPWRFTKTCDWLFKQNLPLDIEVGGGISLLDFSLRHRLDRLAIQLLARGARAQADESPTFSYALMGAPASTLHQILSIPEQGDRLRAAQPQDIADWLMLAARRKDEGLLIALRVHMGDSAWRAARIDLLSASLRVPWHEQVLKLVGEGVELNQEIADGRHLIHEAARIADDEMLRFLRAQGINFEVGPDPWTGLTPQETLAKRLPEFHAGSAKVVPLRRRSPA